MSYAASPLTPEDEALIREWLDEQSHARTHKRLPARKAIAVIGQLLATIDECRATRTGPIPPGDDSHAYPLSPVFGRIAKAIRP